MKQQDALHLLKMGKNVFLTGEAGSGKTFLLNQYIQYLKENNIVVAITASTGIAATHLQGTTIHSWSGMGVRNHLTEKDLEKLAASDRIKRNFKKTKVLIIDEISMLHKQQLEMVNTIARFILGRDEAFGGMQVVLCGDFFQLPPVSAGSLEMEKQFAFETDAWEKADFHVCYLEEQHRQGDDPLLTVLKDIRGGTAGEHTKVPLRTRYKKEPAGTVKATKLYSRNINVDAINERELMGITGKEKLFTMTTTGFSKLVEGLKSSCLALEQLWLKIGAEVMFIKNDIKGRYVNGTRGVVVGFDKKDGWPIVKTYEQDMVMALPEEWKYEDSGVVRATLVQVPLRLAWAITIHKSQGMTLDAAEIDLGDAFEPGMGYVALSRVRGLSGLKLMNLNEMALKVHPKILAQDKIFKNHSAEALAAFQMLTQEEVTQCQDDVLRQRFGGITVKVSKAKKSKKKIKIPTHVVTMELLKKKLSIEAIAAERGVVVATILTHLEKLRSLKLIDLLDITHLKDALAERDFDLILGDLKQSEDGKLTPIYDKYKGEYSYAEIQMVRLFV